MATRIPTRFRKRLRLPGFDYRDEGPYFVTVCTWRKRWLLGTVQDEILHPSASGTIVQEEWSRLPSRFPGLQLDAFTLMPNHVHGILAFETDSANNPSLSTVVGAWKASAALRIGSMAELSAAKVWQRGFHDSIIRNQRTLDAVREYIRENPRKWMADPLRTMD
jgi:REP element-mobilizing transposase RayT